MLKKEVIGQQDIWNRLMEMVRENRVPHALMFCGPQGCGKLAMALAFASFLLGEREEADAAAAQALPPRAMTRSAAPAPCSANGSIPTCTSPSLPSRHRICHQSISQLVLTSLENGERCSCRKVLIL